MCARAAGAAASLGRLIRVRFEPSDQFEKIVGWQPKSRVDQRRRGGNKRNRRQVLQQIVLQRIGGAVHYMSAPMPDAQCVTICAGADHATDRDAAGCTARIFNAIV